MTGVFTDICALLTAVDAYNRGFTLVVHEDALLKFLRVWSRMGLSHFKDTLSASVVSKNHNSV
ncbi:isochorismatase family protein [Fictibacillus sp. 26RED30]|uniref:isochorismatase family protein n=1 Tax=Fictibacillus sp. 26RED30 TaxID=2745877 RepID=UPI001E507A30|nr:isochorismatase family protein [Fictibacillus sp. 26RED30]